MKSEIKEGLREKLQSCQRTVSSQFSTRDLTRTFFDVISVIRLKSVFQIWVSFSGHGVPQVSRGMADWVLGSADLPGRLISALLLLIHHHGFLANWQPEIWAWTMTKDHCWSPPSTSYSPYTPLCLTCTITILCLSSLWVFSLFLFGILLFYLCWWQSFQLQSSITFQNLLPVKVEGGWKAALPCLWVDTWLNGMCTAGKMILLQTVVWIREVLLTPPTQKQ